MGRCKSGYPSAISSLSHWPIVILTGTSRLTDTSSSITFIVGQTGGGGNALLCYMVSWETFESSNLCVVRNIIGSSPASTQYIFTAVHLVLYKLALSFYLLALRTRGDRHDKIRLATSKKENKNSTIIYVKTVKHNICLGFLPSWTFYIIKLATIIKYSNKWVKTCIYYWYSCIV